MRYDLAGAFLAGVLSLAGLSYIFWRYADRPEE